jgi:ribonucleotide reductase alpha subunit
VVAVRSEDRSAFPDLYGEEFESAISKAEEAGKYVKQIKARDLYAKMMRTMAQTGNGWMTFKDAANRKSNQDREVRERRTSLESVHRDHRGHIRQRKPLYAISVR